QSILVRRRRPGLAHRSPGRPLRRARPRPARGARVVRRPRRGAVDGRERRPLGGRALRGRDRGVPAPPPRRAAPRSPGLARAAGAGAPHRGPRGGLVRAARGVSIPQRGGATMTRRTLAALAAASLAALVAPLIPSCGALYLDGVVAPDG